MKILMALLLLGSFSSAFAVATDLGETSTDTCSDVSDSSKVKQKDGVTLEGGVIGTGTASDGSPVIK